MAGQMKDGDCILNKSCIKSGPEWYKYGDRARKTVELTGNINTEDAVLLKKGTVGCGFS
jgi:ferredoxin